MILNSMTTIIFSPSALMGTDDMSHVVTEIEDLRDYMRESPLYTDIHDVKDEKILIPGEAEQKAFDHRSLHGIPVAKGTLDDLLMVANDMGISKENSERL